MDVTIHTQNVEDVHQTSCYSSSFVVKFSKRTAVAFRVRAIDLLTAEGLSHSLPMPRRVPYEGCGRM